MKEIMKSWRSTVDQISETTYRRVLQKIEDLKVPFAIVTADRPEYSRGQNDMRYSEMQQAVKAAGFPFAKLLGSWPVKSEEGDGAVEKTVLKSIIIYDEERGDVERTGVELKELAKILCKTYEQRAFVFGEPGEDTNEMYINAYNQDGSETDYGDWSTIQQIPDDGDFWSKVRGTTFAFKKKKENESQ